MSDTGASIYVVDDDASVREAVGSLIRSAGLRVETFASAREFLASPRAEVASCLVLDLQLPGLTGLDLQQELAKADVQIPIIFLTGHGDIPTTVRAIKAGAREFLTKPFDDEELLDAIRQAISQYHTPRPRRRNLAEHSFEGIIGTSAALRAVLNLVDLVAPTESTVLVSGETGTGKELIARAIHQRSQRAARAFVSVNCAAIPQSLITSELFGHEKGAFTGALQRRLGRFELAEGGTLFLDEVGELPAETQIALLRVLQEREFDRVGGTKPVRSDVRIIAATNRDLHAAIDAGTFRSDLFYRLNVFPIHIPPLRERAEDIEMLARYFVDHYAQKAGKDIRHIGMDTLELLQAYPWPGNIRELQNIIERSVILCDTEDFSLDGTWLSRETRGAAPTTQRLANKHAAQAEERAAIEAALAETRGRVSGPSGAAAKLGMHPSTLDAKIRSLGINKHRFNRLAASGSAAPPTA